MGAKHFDGVTHWDAWDPRTGSEGWSQPGWALPSDPNRYISKSDPYWARLLHEARQAYGDPNIHYSTDNIGEGRQLVFGDGTGLPHDGTIVYHDAATKQSWAQNDDGTVSLVSQDGQAGPVLAPAGYRKVGEHYAPVDDRGQQIAPQLGGVPSNDNGFHVDPATGMLTPKNTNGDYFTFGPDGKKAFCDKNGAPISEEQFSDPAKPRESNDTPPHDGLATDEQQSGKAAEAVKKLQQELKSHYGAISEAEEKLSEVLLSAHAATTAGQAKLNDIQTKIVEAVNTPTMAMDTPAGQRAFLRFLRTQAGEVNDLLSSGALCAQDQSHTAQALSALYAADAGADTPGGPAPPPPSPTPVVPPPDPVSSPDPAVVDPGLAPATPPPTPDLSNLLGDPMGMPMGADPLSSMASLLPALSGLGAGAGANPLDALGGLAGAVSPLSGLASQLGNPAGHERPADSADDSTERAKDDKSDTSRHDTTDAPAAGQQQPAGLEGHDPNTADTPPPTPVLPAAAASATVKLPDGSSATARNPQAAQAIRDYLAGDTIDASYRKNGLQLPPPGTPITHPVDPSQLACGDLAMFKDHYVPVLSSVKAYLNGQVVPLGSVASSPDFLGWIDSTAAAAAAPLNPSPAGPDPAGVPLPPPAPVVPVPAVGG